MCRLFVGADPNFWAKTTRTYRVDGVTVALPIENFYWTILDRIARRDQLSTEELVSTLYFEATAADHTEGSFTSFLMVCCGRYLDLLQKGEIPDDDSPIRALDAEPILERERCATLRLVHNASGKK
ncbi:ribbon-helix-helix domain-containing protein [Aliiroseovarius lamellibrachiae]|uniref:ribbon-helix-helix domain-containing protein n=1 Tax=Aliiroseovarius lamellibrachiae TaxID=1924933 RepID=UPI001BDFCCCE|nr:ribbon-helix-helix domain-containing protein [Aliiroseovarius lamellibrachiae]MBT2129607.1 ribbon-helix-helix domain-containing protein [Aliiroseovarius lamellibrachiae]